MKRRKILVLTNDTTYTYHLRYELLERLIAAGHDVVIACKLLSFAEELRTLGCRLVDLDTNRHGKNPVADLRLLIRYRKLLNDEKPDVVLTYNIKPNVYGSMACRMTKTHYLPNVTGLGTALEYPGLMQAITSRLYKSGIAAADCVFFQNKENRSFFETHHMLPDGAKTRILPGSGVNLNAHRTVPYPDGDGKIRFLFIARVMREKGIDLYLAAARRICEAHGNAEFHVCGQCDDGNYLDRLEEAEKAGYIVYHGEQKDMTPFYGAAHCIVHPSYYPEGMSNVLLEAAAHGRPIITTDRAGCRETVEDGKSGFIIPIKDEDALTDALERFLKMSWEQKRDMGLAGRAKIEREFDREIVVEKYLDEIGKVLK